GIRAKLVTGVRPCALPIVQMAILEPDFAVLGETDSGLDIDALKVVARGVQEVRTDRPDLGVLLITHYQRILSYLQPDKVHVLIRSEERRVGKVCGRRGTGR